MNIRVNFENGKVDWRQDTYDICGHCSKYNSYNRTQEKKKKKKSLIEELTTLKVKIRSAKFATGNEIKWSRRLQKLFENTEENVLELLSLIVPVMRIYSCWLKTTCKYSLSFHWCYIYRLTVYFGYFQSARNWHIKICANCRRYILFTLFKSNKGSSI